MRAYIPILRKFLNTLQKSPENILSHDIESFLQKLGSRIILVKNKKSHLSKSSLNTYKSAISWYFSNFLKKNLKLNIKIKGCIQKMMPMVEAD